MIDKVTLHPQTVQNAAQHAAEMKQHRKYSKRGPKRVLHSETARLNKEVIRTAKELAGGDMRRITLDPKDGSATVWNHPRTTKPQDNR